MSAYNSDCLRPRDLHGAGVKGLNCCRILPEDMQEDGTLIRWLNNDRYSCKLALTYG